MYDAVCISRFRAGKLGNAGIEKLLVENLKSVEGKGGLGHGRNPDDHRVGRYRVFEVCPHNYPSGIMVVPNSEHSEKMYFSLFEWTVLDKNISGVMVGTLKSAT